MKHLHHILITLTLTALYLFGGQLSAQTVGRITVVGDRQVQTLVEKHKTYCQSHRTAPGFRIQVASLSGTDSKRRAFELRDRIHNAFLDTEVYVTFDEPNFKVKVGDFRTRLEAFAFLNSLKTIYPGTIVRDNINIMPTTYSFDFDPNEE